MQIFGSQLSETSVLSLHTGAKVAQLYSPVIDPKDLTIVAYRVKGLRLVDDPSFLMTEDIREMGPIGIIIDGSDELIGIQDVVRIKELYELAFSLNGMSVVDEHGKKLGKVEDYTVDTTGFTIQKIKVKRGFFQGISDTGMLIHRSQIVEITRSTITVKSTAKRINEPPKEEEDLHREYVNPFRKPSAQPEMRAEN